MADEISNDPGVRAFEQADAGGDILHDNLEIDGFRIHSFSKPRKEFVETIRNAKNLELRDDDVFLFSLAKSVEFGDWFEVTKEMEREMNTGKYQIYTFHYEDMKVNGLEEIRKLAKFLEVPEDEELFEAIYEKCQFDIMKVEKAYTGTDLENFWNKDFSIFRKGVIGDWKNHFTVAMNENFDRIYKEKMQDTKLKFKFSMEDI